MKKIEQLTSIQPPPPFISFSPIYFKSSKDSISSTNIMGLENLYKAFYLNKYSSFAYFLFDASNQTIQINWQHNISSIFSIQTFVLNPNIMELYGKNKIQGIIDKYCKKKDDIYILNKTFLNLNEINTISYYFFINQYLKYEDDFYNKISYKNISLIIK